MLLVVMAATLSPSWAATYTAEDLVSAHARGLPTETVTRMAESVGGDADTSVYLLRRGVPADAVRAWGLPVTEAEGMTALRFGALAAPAPLPASPPAITTAVIERVIAEQLEPTDVRRDPGPSYRARLVRGGKVGIAAGALLTVGGGFAVAYSMRGEKTYLGEEIEPAPPFPWLPLGGLGLIFGGVTLHFGAESARLAGSAANPWQE